MKLLLHIEFFLKLILLPVMNLYSRLTAKWFYRHITIKEVYDNHYGGTHEK